MALESSENVNVKIRYKSINKLNKTVGYKKSFIWMNECVEWNEELNENSNVRWCSLVFSTKKQQQQNSSITLSLWIVNCSKSTHLHCPLFDKLFSANWLVLLLSSIHFVFFLFLEFVFFNSLPKIWKIIIILWTFWCMNTWCVSVSVWNVFSNVSRWNTRNPSIHWTVYSVPDFYTFESVSVFVFNVFVCSSFAWNAALTTIIATIHIYHTLLSVNYLMEIIVYVYCF